MPKVRIKDLTTEQVVEICGRSHLPNARCDKKCPLYFNHLCYCNFLLMKVNFEINEDFMEKEVDVIEEPYK